MKWRCQPPMGHTVKRDSPRTLELWPELIPPSFVRTAAG